MELSMDHSFRDSFKCCEFQIQLFWFNSHIFNVHIMNHQKVIQLSKKYKFESDFQAHILFTKFVLTTLFCLKISSTKSCEANL